MKVAIGEDVLELCGDRARGLVPDLDFAVMTADGSWSDPPDGCDLIMLAGDTYVPAFVDRMCELPNPVWAHTEDAGTDGKFYDAMRAKGATVTHSPGTNAPEFAMSFVLWSLKRLGDFRDEQRAHRWGNQAPESLSDKTMLVLGLGAIGGHVVKLARAFGMRVLGVRQSTRRFEGLARQGTLDDLQEMLPTADIVTAALPHTQETRGRLDATALAAMKPSAILVNVGAEPPSTSAPCGPRSPAAASPRPAWTCSRKSRCRRLIRCGTPRTCS